MGLLTDIIKGRIKQHDAKETAERDNIAQGYYAALQTGLQNRTLTPEQLEHYVKQMKNLYGKSKDTKGMFDEYGGLIGNMLKAPWYQKSQQPQQAQAPGGQPSPPSEEPPPVIGEKPPQTEQAPSGAASAKLPPPPMGQAPAEGVPSSGPSGPGALVPNWAESDRRKREAEEQARQAAFESRTQQLGKVKGMEGLTPGEESYLLTDKFTPPTHQPLIRSIPGNKLAGQIDAFGNEIDPKLSYTQSSTGDLFPERSKTSAQTKWVQRPGSEDPELATISSEGGFVDIQGNPMPPNTKATAAPSQQRLYSAVQGYYMYHRGQGRSDAEARALAGEDFRRVQGAHLGRLEQQAAIDQVASRIGMGKGFPKETSPSKREGAREPVESKHPIGTRALPSPTRAKSPTGLTPGEEEDVAYYLGRIMGTQAGGGKAASVRSIRGQQALSKITGLNPMALNAELAGDKATAKALTQAVEVAGAFGRVQETLKAHGKVLIDAARAYDPSGSPLANRSWQWLQRNAAAHPELQRYLLALNAVQREYARLIAGGVQSRAMLPVSSEEKGEAVLRADATLQDILASVDQLRIEADTEQAAFDEQIKGLKERMSSGKIGQALEGKPSSSAASKTSSPRPQIKILKVE